MPQNQCALKRYFAAGRLPKAAPLARLACGIPVLGALRFEMAWHFRDQKPPKQE